MTHTQSYYNLCICNATQLRECIQEGERLKKLIAVTKPVSLPELSRYFCSYRNDYMDVTCTYRVVSFVVDFIVHCMVLTEDCIPGTVVVKHNVHMLLV